MNEPQIPKGSIEHLKNPPPPQGPIHLDYGHGGYENEKRTRVSGQVTMGFLLWLVSIAVFAAMSGNRWLSGNPQLVAAMELFAVVALSLWVRLKFKWRGFIPGVLLGFGLTCLVPIGIVAVVCGGWKL